MSRRSSLQTHYSGRNVAQARGSDLSQPSPLLNVVHILCSLVMYQPLLKQATVQTWSSNLSIIRTLYHAGDFAILTPTAALTTLLSAALPDVVRFVDTQVSFSRIIAQGQPIPPMIQIKLRGSFRLLFPTAPTSHKYFEYKHILLSTSLGACRNNTCYD